MHIALKKGMKIVKENNQTYLVFTVDLQLYIVIISLFFYTPSDFTNVVPLTGGLHWMMASSHSVFVLLLPAIKPIIASTFGSVDKMISGKKFVRTLER